MTLGVWLTFLARRRNAIFHCSSKSSYFPLALSGLSQFLIHSTLVEVKWRNQLVTWGRITAYLLMLNAFLLVINLSSKSTHFPPFLYVACDWELNSAHIWDSASAGSLLTIEATPGLWYSFGLHIEALSFFSQLLQITPGWGGMRIILWWPVKTPILNAAARNTENKKRKSGTWRSMVYTRWRHVWLGLAPLTTAIWRSQF